MRIPLLLPLFVLLASCSPRTETVYDLPSLALGGPNAAACVESCDIQRVRCTQDVASSNGACFSADGAAARGYNGCRPGSPGCVPAPLCLADVQACTARYDACFNSCGGLVRTVRVPRQNLDAMPTTPFVVPPLPGATRVATAPVARRRSTAAAPVASEAPRRDQFIRGEDGTERFVPGQPIRLRRAPASAASEGY